MRLRDKVAIITGGAAGIGQATAELFAEKGASVAIFDIDEAAGQQTAKTIAEKGRQAVFIRTDISDEASISAAIAETIRRFRRLDILVNNAAAFVLKGLEATTGDWRRVLDVNVVGTALCSRYAAEEMKKGKQGAIVNLGSISSLIAQPGFVTYSSTKAAILQMTRNMALDLGPYGIRVNCVCPGTILTRASRDHMEQAGMTLEEFVAREGPKHILGRIGQPREVANAILFLASDEASFITGTHLMVDGGYTAL
jgi:NAD(P)-dependent dehydrogenase (short-subunit alcohol dehydrogenase family)